MATFKYTAFDNKGKQRKGTIEAQSKDMAITVLKRKGVYVETIENISEKKQKSKLLTIVEKKFNRISQKDRSDMFFQLATLLNTGISLTEALSITAKQTSNQKIKEALKSVQDRVSEGEKFSRSISNFKDIFTESYINMIKIAEETGKLSDILFKISQREEEKSSFNQKIAPIVLYPTFVMTLGVGIIGFLLAYVVPKMQKIFESFHQKLPLITRMLIGIGLFLKHYFVILTLIITIIFIGFTYFYKNNKKFKNKIDKLLLNLPIYRKLVISQFSSALAFQLSSGIVLTDAIISSATVINNSIFHETAEEISEKIKSGIPVDIAFKQSNMFDDMFLAATSMGNKTGELPTFINRIANYYDKKLSSQIKTSIALMEPIAILLLGIIVGFIVMSIMVPLFSINQLIK